MKNKKNLDELYRERLLGKEVPPPDDAWGNIRSHLPAKQPERSTLLPLWYKIAGIAAALLITATIALDYFVAPGLVDFDRSNPGLTSEDPQGVEKTEETYGSFEEQIPENVKQPEGIISENRNVKKGRKITSFPAATTLASETIEDEKDIQGKSNIHLPSGETDKNPVTSEVEIILEEITPGAIASQEVESTANMEQEEVELNNPEGSRFSLSTKVAPLFTNGSKSEDRGSAGNSIAYGLSVSYKISKKIAIRSGINKMEISRSAPTVTYAGGVEARSFVGSSNTTLATPTIDVAERNSSFIELPLEMEYTLIDKKLQLHLLGGSSLLFFNNSVVVDNGITAGESGNHFEQQKLHYTGNIGLGLGYSLLKNIEINLEPTLKIRLGREENFNPYYLGIYSGLTYRF